MTDQLTSVWKGSTVNAQIIAHEIAERLGEDAVKEYDPRVNCFTFNGWKQRGYIVRKGEHGMKSATFMEIEVKDKKTGEIKKEVRPRTVVLFYKTQVEAIKKDAFGMDA